ncbi:MAG: hypothetical protein KF706_07660 [Chitinophagales bacterium]|nr:hypothetical protein [Chitinophagales bacterium]
MKKHFLLVLISILAISLSYSQSGRVGIGTSNPEQKLDVAGSAKANDKVIGTRGFVAGAVTADTAKAIFSTDITNKGFYIPRLTTAQKTTLGGTLNGTNKGLLVFDTDLNRTDFWDGTAWKAVGDGAGGPPTGNAGGDLTGTYPNPTIANNAVTGSKVLDQSITNADILDGTINLTTKVNNVLPVSNGGTGVNTVTGAVIGNGSSPVSGVASSSGNQVLRRNNANTAYEFAQVQYSDVAGTPSALPPSGNAGGDLTGTYPNPTVGAGKIDNGKLANDAVSTTKIANDAVTNAKLDNIASNTIKGRASSGTGDPEDLTPSQVKNMLGLSNGMNGSGTTDYVSKFTSTNTIGNSQIFDNGTSVGIGTTNPAQGKLWVDGGDVWIRGNNMRIAFNTDGSTDPTPNASITGIQNGLSGSSADMVFNTWDGAANTEIMRIRSNGSVGINNNLSTNTNAMLSVTPKYGNWCEGIEINPSSGGYNAIFFRETANSITNSWFLGKISNNNFGLLRNSLTGMVATTRGDQPFEVTTTGNSIFGGNVGIKTATPNAALDVYGQAHISRDKTTECCGGGNYTLSLAEATSTTGRQPTIQFHSSGYHEGYIRLLGSQGGFRRMQFGDNQGSLMGIETTGQIMAGSSQASIGTHPTYGENYAALWKNGNDYGILTDATNTFVNSPSYSGNIYFRSNNSDIAHIHRDALGVSPGFMSGDLWIYGVYSYWRGYWLDTHNDLDAIDNMKPLSKVDEKTGNIIQEIDPATIPEVITERGHGIKTDDVNGGAINMSSAIALAWGGVRQLRAETKSRDASLTSRIERLEKLVTQLTGKELGNLEFTEKATAYKGMKNYVIMDARISPESKITVIGLSNFEIVNKEEGTFTILFHTPPTENVKFTYSAKY